MNTIHTITAYLPPKNPRLWVFDDERFGLNQEPFLWDASDFITAIVGKDAKSATLIFSEKLFPESNVILARTWTGEHVAESGCEYLARYPFNLVEPGHIAFNLDQMVEKCVWLCPAMTHYFGSGRAPEFIYGQVVPSEGESS